jgi:hypothetical protein
MAILLTELALLSRGASTWGRIRASLLMSRTLLASVAVVTHLTAVHALFLHFLLFLVIRLDHFAALKRASTWGRIRASLLMSRTLFASVAVVTHLTAVHALRLRFLLLLEFLR